MKLKWTEEEDRFLKVNYKAEDRWILFAKHLPNRSRNAIIGRLSLLQLNLTKDEIRRNVNTASLKNRHLRSDYRGYKELAGSYISHLRTHAESRSLECPLLDLALENTKYLYSLFTGKCSLSGLDIEFKIKGHKSDKTASLDRKDPRLGYIKDNVQWVHKDINEMKWDLDDGEFIAFVNDIYKYRGINHDKN